jgi:hypothetical protein
MRELKMGLRGVEITGSFNCYADIRANYRIYFDDNGEDDLATQAIEAATEYDLWPTCHGYALWSYQYADALLAQREKP